MAFNWLRKSHVENHTPVVVRTTRLTTKLIALTAVNRVLIDSLREVITAWEVSRDLTGPIEHAKAVLGAAQEAMAK